jgi:hypothetical protein
VFFFRGLAHGLLPQILFGFADGIEQDSYQLHEKYNRATLLGGVFKTGK